MTAPHRSDVVLALLVSVLGIVALLSTPLSGESNVTRHGDALGVVLSLGMTSTLAFRRTAPLPSLAVAGVCALVAANIG